MVAPVTAGESGKRAIRRERRGIQNKIRDESEQDPNRGINQKEDQNKKIDAPECTTTPRKRGFFFGNLHG